jgi:class III poly(R)-hydroxyalkanoic acid synthase PhaE subunit
MTEQPKSLLNEWWERQEKFLDVWKESCVSLRPDKMMDCLKTQADTMRTFWGPGSDLTRFYQDWLKLSSQSMQEFVRRAPGGVGADTMDKLLQATDVYTRLFSFWQDLFAGMPKERGEQKWLRFTEDMLENYNSVLNAFFAVNLPDSLKELVKSPLELSGLYRQVLTNMFKPWLESSEELQEKFRKTLQGDRQACMDFVKVCTESYQEASSNILQMPVLGLSKETVEKILGSLDSFNKMASSAANFSAAMYQVGYEAMGKLIQNMIELSKNDAAPDSFKDFYKAWWQTNEEAYFNLFKTESFSKILGEMVDAAASFKKRYDDLLMETVSGSLPVVTNREFDNLSKAVYDLKKALRIQAKRIEEISLEMERLKEREVTQ